jgi:amino acid adenylation domain-containing protein
MNGIASRLAVLSGEQRLRIYAKAMRRGVRRMDLPVVAGAGGPRVRASAQIERMWVADQLAGRSQRHNVPVGVRLCEIVDPDRLALALEAIRRRHRILSARLQHDGHSLWLEHDPCARVPLSFEDLSGLNAERRELALAALSSGEAGQPFDVATAPLWRSTLVKMDQADWVLLLTFHHLACDAPSIQTIVGEIYRAYACEQLRDDHHSDYFDYCTWLSETSSDETAAAEHAFWRAALERRAPGLRWPWQEEALAGKNGAVLEFAVDGAALARLDAFARSCGTTLAVILVAAHGAALGLLTGARSTTCGTPITRRPPDLADTVGLFLDTAICTLEIDDDTTLHSLVAQTKQQITNFLALQQVSFLDAWREKGAAPDDKRPPFETLITLVVNSAAPLPMLPMLRHTRAPTTDLSVTIVRHGAGGDCYGIASFNPALCAPRAVAAYVRLLRDILAVGAETADRRLCESSNLRPPQIVPELLDGSAAADLIDEDCTIAFSDLRRLSWRFARVLRGSIPPGQPVALHMRRGLPLIALLLATQECGIPFLVIDRRTPPGALVGEAVRAGASLLITDQSELADSAAAGVRIWAFTEMLDHARREPDSPIGGLPDPGDAAYIMPTSGSTGRPKLVRMGHHSVCLYIEALRTRLNLTAADRCLHLASFAFSSSIRQLFAPLAANAVLFIAGDERQRDPHALWEFAMAHRISVLDAVPSLQRILAKFAARSSHSDVRLVISSGDRLDWNLVRLNRCAFGDATRLINLYGQTEILGATSYEVPPGTGKGGSVPIGQPLEGVILSVARDDGSDQTEGELTVQSHMVMQAVAAGDGFVPLQETGEGRRWATGDVVKHDIDGSIHVFGRRDLQLKIAGRRVDLEEITRHLEQVVEVPVVVALERAPHDDADGLIIAYGEGLGDAEASQAMVALSRELSPGHRPDVVVGIAAIPRTLSGKVDYAALSRIRREAAIVRPQRETDLLARHIVATISDLVGTAVRPTDNLFECGASSLTVARIGAALSIRSGALTSTDIFREPRVDSIIRRVRTEAEAAALQARRAIAAGRAIGTAFRRFPFAPQFNDESFRSATSEPTIDIHGETPDQLDSAIVYRNGPDLIVVERLDLLQLVAADLIEPLRELFSQPVRISGRKAPTLGPLPLTSVQRAMVAATLSSHKPPTPYWNRTRFSFSAAWNPEHFAAVWKQLLADNDCLRMRIGDDDDTFEHDDAAEAGIACEDWSMLAEPARALRRRHLSIAADRNPPDLHSGPLVSLTLRRLDGLELEGWLTFHHAALDGRSKRTLIDAFVTGAARGLAALPRFRRLADAVQSWPLRSAGARAFWQDALAEFPPPPFWLAHDDVDPLSGQAIETRRRLDAEACAALERAAMRANITVATLAIAAAAYVEARVAGRERAALHVMLTPEMPLPAPLGCLAVPAPITLPIEGGAPWLDFVDRLQSRLTETRRHAPAALSEFVRDGLVPAHALRPGVLFVFDQDEVDWGELTIEQDITDLPAEIVMSWSKCGATIAVRARGSAVGEWAEMVADQFHSVLINIAQQPPALVGDLGSLTALERRRVLLDLNATEQPIGADATVHGRFAALVAATPHHVIAADQNGSVTSANLLSRATELAARLCCVGVGRHSRVALILPRSIDVLATMLACSRLGAAFVPLDPDVPPARNAVAFEQMTIAAAVTVVETENAWREISTLSGTHCAVIKLIDSDNEGYRPSPIPAHRVEASDPAYVLLTSGSTGKPKATAVAQCGMLNHIEAKIRALSLTGEDIIAQTASVSFDVSIWQFLTALVCGGKTMVYGRDVVRDPLVLLDACQRDGVTVLEVVPSFLRLMLEVLAALPATRWPGLERLRWLVVTGEAFPSSLGRDWRAAYPHVGIVNAYGPTECSDDVAHHVISPGTDDFGTDFVPIGRPIINTKLFLLEANNDPVQPGVPGEICVAGACVGPGYLADPSATARAFPVGLLPEFADERFYRTGDLARMRHDGVLIFIGRRDDQVKINGHRIELGEIDAILERVDAVIQAVTIVDNDFSSPQLRTALRLRAGVDAEQAIASAQAAAASALPLPLRPSAYMMLTQMPTLPSGKADRTAIRRKFSAATNPAQPAWPERNIRAEVLRIWQRLLGRELLSEDTRFSQLGGHSLMVVRLQLALGRELGIDVKLSELYQADQFSACVALVERVMRKNAE